MPVPPLVAGVVAGALLVAGLSFAFVQRETDPARRGYITAAGAGIVLSALLDLMPRWLEMVITIGESGLNVLMALFSLNPAAGDIARSALVQVLRLVSILFIFLLYLKASALPIATEGSPSENPENRVTPRPRGWRAWLAIPAETQVDPIGVALVGFGLAMHNLWLGQVRGALLAGASTSRDAVSVAIGLVASLSALALVGLLVGPGHNRAATVAIAMVIGVAILPGVQWPQGRDTLLLGALPITMTMIALPLALGRMLRRIQVDIGLGWRTTVVVLAALVIARQIDRLVLSMAQGAQ